MMIPTAHAPSRAVMRALALTGAMVLAGCGSQPVTPVSAATVVGLVLSPADVRADTGTTLQFTARLQWSDGRDHPAEISYASSGGTISAGGLLNVGSTAGDFLVIATCSCGLTDSAQVHITAPPADSTSGAGTHASLEIAITGLPTGAAAQLVLVEPDGAQRTVSGPQTLDSLTPGVYQLNASSVTVGSQEYRPDPATSTLILGAGAVRSIAIRYVADQASATLLVRIIGLPQGIAGQLTLSGPKGYRAVIQATDTLTGLPAGSYTLDASPVVSGGSTWLPDQTSVPISLSAGEVDTAVVTYATRTIGSLAVTVSGLPTGTSAAIVLNGPDNSTRQATGTVTLDSLAPGIWSFSAGTVSDGTVTWVPTPAVGTVSVPAGSQGTLQVAYALPAGGALPPHPRVWLNPERVQRLRAQAAANTVRWQAVRNGADAQLARGNSYSGSDVPLIPDLCAAYLATGNPQYATRAGVILANYAVPSSTLRWDSAYPYRFNIPLVTMGLDWCYAGLTVAQRRQTASWLMDQADWVWPETNPSRQGAWGLWPSSNYYWGFMQTGPAALAALEDDTIPGRALRHRQLVLDRWNTEAVPYFAGEGKGGAWAEGTNYDSGWYVGEVADAFRTAGLPISNSWFGENLRWRLAATMPDGVHKAAIGDQPRVSDATFYAYDRVAAMFLLAAAGDPEPLGSQIQYWLNWIGQRPQGAEAETSLLAEELTKYDPNRPAAAGLSALPRQYLAAGAGFFTSRTSWTDPAATMWTFESGPAADHGSRNANGLMIWKGAYWVSASANIYSNSGIEQATTYYNNLTLSPGTNLGPGGGSQFLAGGNGGQIVATQTSDALVVVRGQAKDAYGYVNAPWTVIRPVTDYLRTVAYVTALDAFVVVDRVTVKDASLTKAWRWQSKNVPSFSGRDFTLASPAGDYRCFGSVLAPGDVTLGTESYTSGSSGAMASSALTVSMRGRASDVVVTVLQCGSGSGPSLVPVAAVSAGQVSVTLGGTTVVVPMDEARPVVLQ